MNQMALFPGYPGYPNIHYLRYKYLENFFRERFPEMKTPSSGAGEPEALNTNIRYIYVYNPNNPYLMFLVFILLIMSFRPPYQVIAYETLPGNIKTCM